MVLGASPSVRSIRVLSALFFHVSFVIREFRRRGPLPRPDLLGQLPEVVLAERVVEVAEAFLHLLALLERVGDALEAPHIVLQEMGAMP